MVQRFKDDTPDVPSRSNLRGQKFEGVGRWDPVMVLLGIVFMVLFPPFVTIIAPTSRISLAYDGKNISASVQSLVFLTIPYRTTRLANVTDVSTGFSAGVVERDHSVQGESSEVRTEDSASLTLPGAGPDLRVMVSPVNIDAVRGRVADFIRQPDRAGLSFFITANWKARLFVGGPLSLLAYLYATCLICSVVNWTFLKVKSAIQ